VDEIETQGPPFANDLRVRGLVLPALSVLLSAASHVSRFAPGLSDGKSAHDVLTLRVTIAQALSPRGTIGYPPSGGGGRGGDSVEKLRVSPPSSCLYAGNGGQ